MTNKYFSIPKITQLVSLLLVTLAFTISNADCRIGEQLSSFHAHISKAYKLSKKTDTTYWYVMNINPKQAEASPGFGVGLTISVKNNQISGESMAISLGTNSDAGFVLAAVQSMTFVYDAIGKPLPKNKAQSDVDLEAFAQAARLTLAGQRQNLKYAGYNDDIFMTVDNLGNLIVAVVPPAQQQPQSSPLPTK